MLAATKYDISNETWGWFPTVLTSTKLDIYDEKSGHFPVVSGQEKHIILMRLRDISRSCLRQHNRTFSTRPLNIFTTWYQNVLRHPVTRLDEHVVMFIGERRLVLSLLPLHYWCGQNVVSCLKTPEELPSFRLLELNLQWESFIIIITIISCCWSSLRSTFDCAAVLLFFRTEEAAEVECVECRSGDKY